MNSGNSFLSPRSGCCEFFWNHFRLRNFAPPVVRLWRNKKPNHGVGCGIGDAALDRGGRGTRGLRTLLKVLIQRIHRDFLCASFVISLDADSFWFDHICPAHPNTMKPLSSEKVLACLKDVNTDRIFSITNLKLNSIRIGSIT